MTDRCDLQVTDYRILFDDDRYPASGCSLVKSGDRLLMTVQRASDAERGISSLLTQSDDLGATWTEPRPFGPPLADPDTEFQGVAPAHVLDDGTVVACGIHLAKGFDRASGGRGLYRPSDILIGHRTAGADEFSWNRIAAGTFLTEQFIAPGIALPDGRLVFTVWGSAVRGDNWQCGVLLSDDGGRALRYRQVGYEPDPAIRKDPEVMAGFNEQTLFAAADGTLVSVIRGRDHLGGIPGSNPRSSDCLFFRAASRDRGETWSAPEATDLPGTGAPAGGLALPDGSLVLPARLPSHWSRHRGHSFCGMHMARSFDQGRTWSTDLLFDRTPDGEPFDNYYNAMNGTFIPLGDAEATYVFGHFRPRSPTGHRAYAVHLRWD